MTVHNLNPNHPLHQQFDGHWQKLCALIMKQLGVTQVTITNETIEEGDGVYLAIGESASGILLALVSKETAHSIAAANGGLLQ